MTRAAGLTLIELLVTLVLLAVLATSGIPTFTDLILDMRMTAKVNRFVRGVHLAKQAAHRALTEVALCKSTDGKQCAQANHWHDGWIVFMNIDADTPPRVDPGERVLDVGGPFASGTITANRQTFRFRPFETRSTNGTLTFCDRRGIERSRSVVVSYTGRPRTVRGAAGDLPGCL